MKECFIGGTIVHNLTSRDKFSAIQEIIHKAPVFSGAKDTKKIKNAVLDREKIHSTGLGRGVAIAHGETEEVDNLTITLGISPGGIDFDACDKEPAKLIFIITHPPGMCSEYIIALAAITRVVRDNIFRNALQGCRSSCEAEKMICDAFKSSLKKYRLPAV
ncbi:MAG TPA: PTS sugar transporter subunit IIA [Spirochaetales bacterium]|nr:PTS sugar transporter subunit IIA [Spirochaetales bacterium]